MQQFESFVCADLDARDGGSGQPPPSAGIIVMFKSKVHELFDIIEDEL
jgi:hypothetical protein